VRGPRPPIGGGEGPFTSYSEARSGPGRVPGRHSFHSNTAGHDRLRLTAQAAPRHPAWTGCWRSGRRSWSSCRWPPRRSGSPSPWRGIPAAAGPV